MIMDQEANTGERQDVVAAGAEADLIRTTERERLRALVQGNTEVAHRLHADDFQLIHPGGGSLSKEQYLGGIASGRFKYLVFEPEAIEVRVYGDAAVIRYQSHIQAIMAGTTDGGRFWHTDSYEKRDGRWQAVWSHATRIP
jgi:Domain of unknown function (DUF4440)